MHKDRLDIMFEMQDVLERITTGHLFSDLAKPEDQEAFTSVRPGLLTTRDERIRQFKEMFEAGIREAVEQMDEIGSKPWAISKHWNEDAVKKELVDEWHFFMAKCLLAGLTPRELFEMYKVKWQVNVARQENDYDGVTTKCPKCKRALDDATTPCIPAGTYSTEHPDMGYCYRQGEYREEVKADGAQ